ncbi:MAG: hypothetical protein GY749_19320 [Desulfobacteraceae bacterium]|nr:hypothetical protein [Desulfobacteraceae bacterium]
MKKISLLVILMVILGSVVCLYAQELIDKSLLKDLGEFDGLKNEILGPMNMPIPGYYFTEETSSFLGDKEYHSTIEIDMEKMQDSILVLKNTLEDGQPYPIVISFELPGKRFRNYITKFGEESKLIISLKKELKQYKQALKNESLKNEVDNICLLNVISSFSFTGEIYENGNLLPLEVNEPEDQEVNFDPQEWSFDKQVKSSGDDIEECCFDSHGKIKVYMIHMTTNVTHIAWIDIDRVNVIGYKYVGELRCYYPTSTQLYHDIDPVRRQFEKPDCHYIGDPSYYCSKSMNWLTDYYTVGVTYGEGTRWSYMDKVIFNTGHGVTMDFGYDPYPPTEYHKIYRY